MESPLAEHRRAFPGLLEPASPLGETLSPEGQPQLEGSVPLQSYPFRPQEGLFHIHK